MIPIDELLEKVKVTHTEFDSDGSKKGNIEYSWKREKGTK